MRLLIYHRKLLLYMGYGSKERIGMKAFAQLTYICVGINYHSPNLTI